MTDFDVGRAFERDIEDLRSKVQRAKKEVQRVIVGQEEAVDSFFIALFAGGHYIVEGLPGLAKTKLMKAAARVCGLSFGRIQGNAGLTPQDIGGSYVKARDPSRATIGGLEFIPSALFSQLVVWDEANRTHPRAQSELLEGMEEFRVTDEYGMVHPLPLPFRVMATQNPREVGGAIFPLTSANIDRFLLMSIMDYPTRESEVQMVMQDDKEPLVSELQVILSEEEICRLCEIVPRLYPADRYRRFVHYVVNLCRATRPEENHADDFPNPSGSNLLKFSDVVERGVSPRAEKLLSRAARVDAFLRGEELRTSHAMRVAHRVLRHRLVLASQEDIGPDTVIDYLLASVPEVLQGGVS